MELLLIVLNKPEYLQDILTLFLEYDIHGATVMDSSGMGHIIANRSPMFSMFAEMKNSKRDNSKTIFTVINTQEERDNALKAVENVLGDISKPDTAVFFSLPVSFEKGMIEEND